MDVKLLIIASSIIASSLAHVFNLSLSSEIFPCDLKLARVTPLYKVKGEISEMGNYRPISDYRPITDYQMAYMKGCSTQTAMNYISNKFLSNINNGLYTCACLIDLSKCFDCVHNELLLQKVTQYGIFNVEHNWFKSYLHNRQQIVTFNNRTSSVKNIDIGVPQGTVLGPILLLILCSSSSLQDATLKLQVIVNKTAEGTVID